MSLQERIKNLIENKGVTPYYVAQKTGVSEATISRVVNKKSKKLSSNTVKLLARYFKVNEEWLLTGNGDPNSNISDITQYSINKMGKGVPYYDVDFIGGFNELQNDQTIVPAHYIDFPQYACADRWVNVTGQSMSPLINHGDIMAIRKLEEWDTYILYGEVYAIVTDEYRTIKKIRKSAKGDDFLLFIPENPDFDEQDIPKNIIRHIFQVLGCAKKIF